MGTGEAEKVEKESFGLGLAKVLGSLGIVTAATFIISYVIPEAFIRPYFTEEFNRGDSRLFPKQRKSIIEDPNGDYVVKIDGCTYILGKRTKEIKYSNSKSCLDNYENFLDNE